MRKRIITLLTVLLLSTTGLSAPFTLPVYADEADDADANVPDLDDAGDEYTGFPDEELEDYDGTNEADDTDSADATNPVKIKNNTKLSTTDANVVSKYQTMLNFAFRTTDDRYYTNDVFAVYSAAQWWLKHNSKHVVYAGGAEGFETYFENYLYNVRSIFNNGKFFSAYTGKTNTILVDDKGNSNLRDRFNVKSNYAGLMGKELDWRWFVEWEKPDEIYKNNGTVPNYNRKTYIPLSQVTPSTNKIKDGKDNVVTLYGNVSTYEDYYKHMLKKISSRQDYKRGLDIVQSLDTINSAKTSAEDILKAYNYVAVIKFLQDSTYFFDSVNKQTNISGATAIDWNDLSKAFDPVSGKVTTTIEIIKDSYLLNKDNASCNRYILFRNNKRIESISEGDNKSPALSKYLADVNASEDGYYLYLYMKSGVARNTTECANMFKTDLTEETATKWWRSTLDKDTRKPYKDAISRFAKNHSFTTKDSDGVLQANYFNIYDAYCKNKLNLTDGAFVSRGKPVKADETKYGLNSPDNTVLNGYYCPSYAFWDGDIRKPMYVFPTATRNLAKNYNKKYSAYKCSNGNQVKTQAFKSTNGSPVVYTDTGSTTGDFAVQLYTVGSPFTNAYASYQSSAIQPVDNYARSKTWKDAITFINTNANNENAVNVNGRYVLRTGLAVAVKSIQAPNYSESSVENNIEQKYTFDKVTYQKYDANFADYVDGDDGDINDMVDKSVVKLADVIKISNNRSYIDTKATYPMTTINNKLPLTPRTGDVTTSSDNTSSNIGDHIAYAWCGRLSNLSKDMSAKKYNKIASDEDTKKVVNYVAGKGKYYAHTFSTDFQRYSVLYRVYKGAEVGTSDDRGKANCHNHYPSATCNQHKKTCNINKYSTVHDENCPLHVSKNSDMSDLTAQGVYCNCDKVACTCSKRNLKSRKWHTKTCPYYRQNLANAQYRNYFTTEKNKNHADDNLDLLYKSIAACNTSPILSAGYKQIQLNLYKNDGNTKKVTLYLGKYDDIFDRAYISQYWQTTKSNTDGGPGEVQAVIERLYGKNWNGIDSVFDTTKVENKPYKDSQAIYPEANTYHWETAPVDMYMHHDNNYVHRSYSKLAGDKSLSENYYDSLVFAFDWYRAMPVSEVTVWYKPATYNVAYHSNVPTPSGTTSDNKVYLKADTSLSNKTDPSPYLVYYDDYSLSAPKDAFGTDRWNEMEKAAAVAGYTFDHWNVCLDGDTNAISAASNNANASTWYSSGNIISINPQGAASNMQFNINSEQTRYPFMYNNVMDNVKNSSHTINVYAVWKKSEYAVYYTSNQGAASKIFPDPSITTDEAKSSTSEYKDGYVHGNSSTNNRSKVLATETINSKIADPSNQFLRPGYFIIGYSLFDTGAPNDTCGTEYYNGASHDSSAAWSNHTGLVNNAGNTTDGSGKLYSADSYGSDNLTAAYKRNTTNFSPYNHLTTYGNLLVSNPDKLNVRSFGDVGPIDFTKSPFNNAANNMGYYSNYIVTLRNSAHYATWQQAVADFQKAQTDPRNVYSSTTMRGMMRQALIALDNGLKSVTKDNDDLYKLLCHQTGKALLPADNLEFWVGNTESQKIWDYGTSYNSIIHNIDNISWRSYNSMCATVEDYITKLQRNNPYLDGLNTDMSDLWSDYVKAKQSMEELASHLNSLAHIKESLDDYVPTNEEDRKQAMNLLKKVNIYLTAYGYNTDGSPSAAYKALSDFDCYEATANVCNIDGNALGYLEKYVRAEYNEAFQVTPAAVFYAHWEPDRFYVRYNQNDANVASSRNPDGVQLSGNSKVEADPQPTYPGHTSLLLYPGQFSNKSVYYGDPTVTYANNQWQRVNAYNIIDKNEDSDYLGWSDVVTTDGAGAYTAKFGDGTNFNYGEMLKTVFNSADGSPQVDDLTDKYYNYIYNLYAIFDDWPIMYIQEQAAKSGYSMLYDTASGLLTGASGVNANLLDAHTKTELETHLLSSNANGSCRLPIIAYDREDSASNSSAVTNNNTWNKIAGPQVIQIQNPPNCTEVNRPTGVVTWIGANGYADPTAFPASLGYVNGSSNQGNMSNIAQIYIDPTGSNRKDDGSVGVRNTYYHLRFFDPSYVLNKVDNTQETKFELRYFIKDSRGKGYERQANFYVGANAKINIMDNP